MTRAASGDVHVWHTTLTPSARTAIAVDIDRILRTGRMIDGPFTLGLETTLTTAFATRAVAVSSAMDGLELLLETLTVRNRIVLIPANAFPSIPAMVVRLGGTPVPVPVEHTHLAPRPDVVTHPATSSQPVVIWIHHGGLVADHARTSITALRRAGCPVIEDCAYLLPGDQSAGGPGTWGTAAVLSFGPTKPLSATGGAAILTTHDQVAAEVADRRSHSGQETRWQNGDLLYRNRAITEMAACVAVHQFEHRHVTRSSLASLAATYTTVLGTRFSRALVPGRAHQEGSSRFLIDTRPLSATATRDWLSEHGIHSSIMFEQPWFDYPALTLFRDDRDWADQRDLLGRTLCLPFHPGMSTSDTQRVATALATITQSHKPADSRHQEA